MGPTEYLFAALIGGIYGLIAAGIGYCKQTSMEKFALESFGSTIIVGFIVGLFAGYSGIPYMNALSWLTGIGAVYTVDYLWKIIWRRVFEPAMRKSGAAPKLG